MSMIQVLKRVPRLILGFTMYCPFGLWQAGNLTLIYKQSPKTPSSGPLLYHQEGFPSTQRGGSWGLTGRTHRPGLCSDTPRCSGSAGHSPPEAERS